MAKIDIYFDPKQGTLKLKSMAQVATVLILRRDLRSCLVSRRMLRETLSPNSTKVERVRSAQSPCDAVDLITAFLEQSYLCALLHLSLTAMTNARLNSISNALNTHEDHL